MLAELISYLTTYFEASIGQFIILTLYITGAVLITIYSVGQFHLLFIYLKKNAAYSRKAKVYKDDEWPYVTVQLPMFNELYVAEHVIDACAKLDYPLNKLEIQVLDDSTDETLEIVNKSASAWRQKGVDIAVIHRENRNGFKAGALAEATPIAKGDFIAIFDADFRPYPDFLKKTIGYFEDPEVGVVQGRWGHLNRNYSLLTRAQSLLHDAFFIVEQQAREIAGYFLRFNGSAGIWRKSCIADAGGWSGETLSEDYDLCLRAQMKKWKIIYDVNVEAPAELPVTMTDFKAQQYRWTKGRGQIIKKLLIPVLKSDASTIVKIHAMFDMLNVLILVGIFLLAIASIPIVMMLPGNEVVQRVLLYFSISLINVLLAPWYSWLVMKYYETSLLMRLKEMVITFLPFAILIIGSPFFLLVSLFDGFFNKKSHFHRTSKYNAIHKEITWKDKLYSPKDVSGFTWFEAILAAFFAFGVIVDIGMKSLGFLPFHITLFLGYSFVFVQSFRRA
ncbi:glycosyltransferase [bacterium]|nr:MAG: glycosyltransferase [bacterium]